MYRKTSKRALNAGLAAMALLAVCLFQLPTQIARATPNARPTVDLTIFQFYLGVGIARGQTLRAGLANLSKLEGREQNPKVCYNYSMMVSEINQVSHRRGI